LGLKDRADRGEAESTTDRSTGACVVVETEVEGVVCRKWLRKKLYECGESRDVRHEMRAPGLVGLKVGRSYL
jgi:hypothetical protein